MLRECHFRITDLVMISFRYCAENAVEIPRKYRGQTAENSMGNPRVSYAKRSVYNTRRTPDFYIGEGADMLRKADNGVCGSGWRCGDMRSVQLMKGSEKLIKQYHVTSIVVKWWPVAVRP